MSLIRDGETVLHREIENVELVTRRNIDRLREKGNIYNMIFRYEGDGVEIPLGELSPSESGKTELVVNVAVSDPENQWGNRIRLNMYLEHK